MKTVIKITLGGMCLICTVATIVVGWLMGDIIQSASDGLDVSSIYGANTDWPAMTLVIMMVVLGTVAACVLLVAFMRQFDKKEEKQIA
jgi:hypothetical protein